MWHNIKNNYFIIISGLETLLLGSYLLYVANLFTDKLPLYDHFHHIIQHAQDPWLAIILVVIGTFAIMIALFDLNKFRVRLIAITSMTMIWSVYFVVFLVHDVYSPEHIGFGTILVGFVVIRLITVF